jgi:hypothetical protein
MIASGGPLNFIRANLDYVTDQASVTSGLFGATESRWLTTWWRLLVWVFCGVLAWGLPAALAFRWKDGFGIPRARVAFLALWLLPSLAFALTVHLEDPGQTLAMIPVVCLLGGLIVGRAIENAGLGLSRFLVPIAIGAAFACERIYEKDQSLFTVQWLSLACLATGVALRIAPVPARAFVPRPVMIVLILAPILILNYTFFYNPGWYYKGTVISGFEGFTGQAWADINTGFSLTSLQQIKSTLAVDDHTLSEMRRLIAERPGNTIVIWERGLTAWRKAAYYAPGTEIAVLEHKKIRSSPPVVVIWRGATLERRLQGGTPLRLELPAGARIVWLLNTRTDFYQEAQRNFALTAAGPVWFTDLPRDPGARQLGEYELAW